MSLLSDRHAWKRRDLDETYKQERPNAERKVERVGPSREKRRRSLGRTLARRDRTLPLPFRTTKTGEAYAVWPYPNDSPWEWALTKPPPPLVRARNRARSKIARASRKANRR